MVRVTGEASWVQNRAFFNRPLTDRLVFGTTAYAMKLTPLTLFHLGTSVLTASASVTIDADLFQSSNHFGSPGTQNYAFFNVYFDGPNYLTVDISSPSGQLTGGSGGTGSSNFPTFEDLRSEIQSGSWTLTLARDLGDLEPVISTYYFNVDVSGITMEPAFTIEHPLNGSTGVPTGPTTFQWTPPSGTYDEQGVDLTVGQLSRPTLATIPIGPSENTWSTDSPGLSPGTTYLFFVQYSRDVTGMNGVSISAPGDELSNELEDFSFNVRVHNEANSVFTTVPEPSVWAGFSAVGLAAFAWARRQRVRVGR